MWIFSFETFNFLNWSLSVTEQYEPAVVASSCLPKIHLNEVFLLFQVFMNDVLLDFTQNNWFSLISSEISLMLNKVDNTRLSLAVQNNILSAIQQTVGFGIFGCLKNFIYFDRISFMVFFYSEQKNSRQQYVEDNADG